MKVRITQGVSMAGIPFAPGDIADFSDFDALYLIGGGRAEKYSEPKPVVAADPEPKNQQPEPINAESVPAAVPPNQASQAEVPAVSQEVESVPEKVPAVQDTATKKSKKTEK